MSKMRFTDDHGNEITVGYVLVTPELAKEWLERNIQNNRRIKDEYIRAQIMDLNEGNFVFNGSTIKFDDQGNMIDGQHRLTSIVRSGISAWLLVVSGLGSEVLPTIDTNCAGRSISDILKIEGHNFKNGSVVAGVKMILVQGTRENDLWKVATNRARMAEMIWADRVMLEQWSDWSKSITSKTDLLLADQQGRTRSKKAVTPAALGALAYIMHENGADAEHIDLFFTSILTGAYSMDSGLSTYVPLVRNYLRHTGPLVREGGGSALSALFRNFDTVIRTFNRWMQGEEIQMIRRGGTNGEGIRWIDEIELPIGVEEEPVLEPMDFGDLRHLMASRA